MMDKIIIPKPTTNMKVKTQWKHENTMSLSYIVWLAVTQKNKQKNAQVMKVLF